MHATLKFLADLPLYDEEKPYTLYGFPDDVQPKSNCEFTIRDNIPVKDVRGREAEFKLDECGFEFHHKPSQLDLQAATFQSVGGREGVWRYLRETMDMAEETLHASKVLCFDWRFRRTGATSGVHDQMEDLENARYKALAPASLMHCGMWAFILPYHADKILDYSYTGGLETLEIHLTAEELAEVTERRSRAKIVNVWRPLRPVQHTPLVLCDRRTVRSNDILEVDQVAPTKVELSMSLKFREGQQYYWLSNQTAEEVVFFTSWDSEQNDLVADHTPHGAFMNGPLDSDMNPRESVEGSEIQFDLGNDT